jgi:hypothetical protein
MNTRTRYTRAPLAPTAPRPLYRSTDTRSRATIQADALILYARLTLCDMGIDPDGAPSYVETLLDRCPLPD